jgi:predicted Holliday junction resolvase-like endonuclease
METLANSEIFFVIAGIALIVILVVLATLLIIALVYVIKIVRSVRRTLTMIDAEVEHVIEDIETMRQSVKEKAGSISSILGAILSAMALRGMTGKKKK